MRTCGVEGCNRKHYGKGYCKKHYARMFRRSRAKHGGRTMYDPNEIIIKGDIAEIVLYNRKCQEVARAIIDTEDVEKTKKHKWRMVKGYVVTHLKGKSVGLSHTIMGANQNIKMLIDHKDRNPLNNRKSNFRFCTPQENIRNRPKPKNNTSGHKGVVRSGRKWGAQIGIGGGQIWLGTFKTKEKAAMAYNTACLEHFKEFACLNFV